MRLSRIRLIVLSFFLFQAVDIPVWAFDPFVIKDIRVEGIQRTEAGTIFSYLPVKVGERYGVSQPKPPWGKTGRIDARLGRDPRERKKMAVLSEECAAGKSAITNYEVVERFAIGFQGQVGAGACELVCKLETGRTHQIRVHMAHIGVPLIGDHVYGDTKTARALASALPDSTRLTRQALHAQTLAFTHPATSERMSFQSDLPHDMVALQAALKDL